MSAAETPVRLDHPDGEERWLRDDRWSTVAHVDARAALTAYGRLVVVAAHPDDECLGAGPLVADAADLGLEVVLLALTDGEASHPHSPTLGAAAMAVRRRGEAEHSLALLAPGARLVRAGLPDGGLVGRHDEVVAAVRDLLDDRTLVLAPWTADGHPDHDAAGRGAAEAVAAADGVDGRGPGLAHYLVWFWHWSAPDDLPWEDVLAVDGSLAGIDRAARAVEAHHTQVTPLSPRPGDERLLTDDVLAPSRRGFTTLLLAEGTRRPSTGTIRADDREATFDAMFDDGDDPWSSETWYERRKRDLTLAVLLRERYDRVLDVGCSTGALTRELAARAGSVVGVDASRRALDVAWRETPAGVQWVHGKAPEAVARLGDVDDDGRVDLVVLSEVLYFLTPFEVWLTLAAVLQRLAPGGEVVLVDWRHPTEDIPLDGPAVHAQVRAALRRWSRVEHKEPDVLVDSFVVGDAPRPDGPRPDGPGPDGPGPTAVRDGSVTR